MEIMKLIPTGKDYLWGGTRLREEYGKQIDLTPLAETWECSVHPDGPSYVANGIYKGQTLAEVLSAHPEYLGTKVENGELPVLVKFIDAKKDLSVQVHPDDAYAREHEGDNGKTEMWYVVDADEGAHLIYGFQHKVTEEILRKAVETGTLDKHLQKVEVHKGDTYFVPAGTVHGIGKGILVAEIQESSNVTYRVYDYDRVDKNGKKRELHFDKAVQVMDMNVEPDVSQKPRIVKYYSGCSRELLCRCKYFETERIQVTKGFAFSVMDTSFQVLMCLNGYGELQTMDAEQKPMRFSKGETLFLPAASENLYYAETQFSKRLKTKSYLFIKRLFDFLASLAALILLSPLMLILAILVYLDDPGKVFYGHLRIGKNGKPFKVWKFRSMYMNADKMIDLLTPEQAKQYYTEFKIDNDPRITKIGNFLRKTSLDELPQLFNVLCNDMSLVGPRPLIESEIQTYYADMYDTLLAVKPGVTGYWQAYARNNATYQSGERQKMEMYYVHNASLWLDIKILFKTIGSVLKKQGAQ